jgi:hypothetical protein
MKITNIYKIKHIKNALGVALLVLFVTSCLTDTIQPDIIEDYTPKMVVNGLVEAGRDISIELTSSSDISEDGQPGLVRGANVQVAIGRDAPVALTFDELNLVYKGNVQASEGETVSLRIVQPEFTQVNSTISIPVSVSATGNVNLEAGVDSVGNPTDIVSVSFQDNANARNYYKINLFYLNVTINEWIPLALSRDDPSFAEFNSFLLNDAGILFTDELFNGSTKTIVEAVNSAFAFNNPNEKYRVDISSITEDYFNHFRSLQRAEDAKESSFNGGFNNAVVISSNINNGLGILGGSNPTSVILP